jgi:hypothetical protein
MRLAATTQGVEGLDDWLEQQAAEDAAHLHGETSELVLDALLYVQGNWGGTPDFDEDSGRSRGSFGIAVGKPYAEAPSEGQGSYPNVSRAEAEAALAGFDPLTPKSIFMGSGLTADTSGKPSYVWYLEEGHHGKAGAHVVAAAGERASS